MDPPCGPSQPSLSFSCGNPLTCKENVSLPQPLVYFTENIAQ